MTRALYSLIVGVIVMLALPVSQLRLDIVRIECCCPDPEQCKCPDHEKRQPGQTRIEACHKTKGGIASVGTSTFVAPARIAIDTPSMRAVVIERVAIDPHEPPDPARPPRPS